jgi:hypothetical protein
VIGIFAAEDFPEDVFNRARSVGLLVINLNQLFGETALLLMVEVEKILKAVKRKEDTPNFSELRELLNSLKTNPFLVQLRSLAFETAVAYVLNQRGWESVQLALDVPFQEVTRDVDVYGYREGFSMAHIVECKAEISRKELAPNYVSKFFTETVPAYRRWHEERLGPIRSLIAEIWTTGEVGEAAEAELNGLRLNAKIQPKLRGGAQLREEITSAPVVRLLEAVSAAPIVLNSK